MTHTEVSAANSRINTVRDIDEVRSFYQHYPTYYTFPEALSERETHHTSQLLKIGVQILKGIFFFKLCVTPSNSFESYFLLGHGFIPLGPLTITHEARKNWFYHTD